MDETSIDARGLACPEPVILARKALLAPGTAAVQVLVDSDVSAENIRRMAHGQGWTVATLQTPAGTVLRLTKAEATAPAGQPVVEPMAPPRQPQVVVFISSDRLGSGDDTLGRILLRAFVKTLNELEPRPCALIFANAGVRLTTVGSDLLDDLRALERQGVRILSCGTCLDYFHLLDSLRIGTVSNMYEIASMLLAADRVVRP